MDLVAIYRFNLYAYEEYASYSSGELVCLCYAVRMLSLHFSSGSHTDAKDSFCMRWFKPSYVISAGGCVSNY